MPPTAALFKFHLAAILLALGSASCPEIVRCPCGSTGINYTFCNVHLLSTEEACRTWSRCLQCQDEVNHCLECPVGFTGPTCTSKAAEVMHSRPKRQYRPNRRETPTTPTASKVEKDACPDPGFVPEAKRIRSNGSLASESQEFRPGESLIFSCRRRGYALEGPTLITCTDEGTWSDELPRCVHIGASCPDPGVVASGRRFNIASSESAVETGGGIYRPGQSVVYACSSGFVMHGASMLTCQQSGSWSEEKPFCSRVATLPRTPATTTGKPDAVLEFCPDPGVDVNGARTVYPRLDARRRHQGFPQGSQLSFSCKEGFSLQGADSLFCVIGGEWSLPTPTCAPQPQSAPQISLMMYCGDPGPISNGRVTVTPPLENPRDPATGGDIEYPQGTRLQYSCEDSYTLRGAESITCETNGFWSSEMPSCVGECGRSDMQTTRRVTHGKTTTAGEWPWTVAVASLYNNHSRVICGGALLNSRTILTAAHCFDLPDTYQLFFGKYKRKTADDDDKVQSTTRLSLMIHPNYNSSTYDADIALVRFSPSIRFNKRIRPICLPTIETTANNIVRGRNGSVTGWGQTENRLPADSLLLAKLAVLPAHHCIKAYENRGLRMPITPNMFCAGFKNGQTNVCTGDSGSPMVFYDSNQQRHTIEGVVSFGVNDDCNLPGRYTVFTKVLPYMPWILRNMS